MELKLMLPKKYGLFTTFYANACKSMAYFDGTLSLDNQNSLIRGDDTVVLLAETVVHNTRGCYQPR